MADRFTVVLLRRQNPVRQQTQTLLKLQRLIQAFLVEYPAFLGGFLHGLAMRIRQFSLAVSSGEFLCARSQRGFQLDEVSLRASRRTPMLFNG